MYSFLINHNTPPRISPSTPYSGALRRVPHRMRRCRMPNGHRSSTEVGAAVVALHQDIRLTHIAQPLRAVGVVAPLLSRKILLAEAADSEVAAAAAKHDVTLKAPFALVRLGEAVGEMADRALQGWSLLLTNAVLGARGPSAQGVLGSLAHAIGTCVI